MSKNQRIKDVQQISGLLQRIVDNRSLLTVLLPGSDETYTSAVLKVRPDQRYLILDELTPRRGHERLLECQELHARTALHGVELQFSSVVDQVSADSDIFAYRVKWPAEVIYLQKRASFRVRIGMCADLSVSLERDGRLFHGTVVDLSTTGIGMLVNTYLYLRPGDLIPCVLRLPDQTRIQCELNIRFARPQQRRDRLHFGGQFVELSKPQQNKLARFVADMQREMIRKRPKD